MFKNGLLCFLSIVLLHFSLSAVPDVMSTRDSLISRSGPLRISLLTCGIGNEPWGVFGHTALRVIDRDADSLHNDLVYNYGIIDQYDGSFAQKFFKGRISVFLEVSAYSRFIVEYRNEGRSIEEQVLLLDDQQKAALLSFLQQNALTENKYYMYDFFLDNCSTRVRDLFPKVYGPGFVFGRAVPDGLTFRQAANTYYEHRYWEKIFMNLLWAGPADKPISNADAMYLPFFLSKAVAGATLNGKEFAAGSTVIQQDQVKKLSGPDMPFILACFLALLTVIGLYVKRMAWPGQIVRIVIFVLTGLIGCAILYCWLCADYTGWKNNLNLLWALPTNLFIVFMPQKLRVVYAAVALLSLLAAVIVHILKIQVMPLGQVWPLWLAITCFHCDTLLKGHNSKASK